jgi:hypothetical protein
MMSDFRHSVGVKNSETYMPVYYSCPHGRAAQIGIGSKCEICSLKAENKALKHLLRRVFEIVFQNESGLYRIAKLKALLQEDAKEGESWVITVGNAECLSTTRTNLRECISQYASEVN